MSRLNASTSLTQAADAISGNPAGWLPGPARPAGIDAWLVNLHLGRIHRTVRFQVGPVWADDGRVHRVVRWRAVDEEGDAVPFSVLLPPFTGLIVGDDESLQISGHYEPPASVLGRTADLLLRHLAARTVRALVEDIATTRRHQPRKV